MLIITDVNGIDPPLLVERRHTSHAWRQSPPPYHRRLSVILPSFDRSRHIDPLMHILMKMLHNHRLMIAIRNIHIRQGNRLC